MLHVFITIIVSWLVFTNTISLIRGIIELKKFVNKEVKYLVIERGFGVTSTLGTNEIIYLDGRVISYVIFSGLKITTHLSNVIIYSHEK